MKSNFFAKAFFGLTLITVIFLVSCKKDTETPLPSGSVFNQGVFIVNEGTFNTTGTITFMDRNGSNYVNKLFQQANNLVPLGSLVQSMNVIGSRGFIAVNNANTLIAVSMNTFQSEGSLNVSQPRYIVDGGNGRAYVSSWDNKVIVIDPQILKKWKEIETGTGPEKMMKVNDRLWVLNQGGFSIDSTITVIDLQTEEVETTLHVYPKPSGIQLDKNGNVWVTCSGYGWNGYPDSTDTHGHLICLDPSDYSVIRDFEFPSTDKHPEKLVINSSADRLFYVYPGGVFDQLVDDDTLQLKPFIIRSGVFYGLGYDFKEDMIYASDPLDFSQKGWVYRYDATTGTLADSVQAGIGPGEFYFTN